MAPAQKMLPLGGPGTRPRLYHSLSGYAHANVDVIARMAGSDGLWRRDIEEMFHHLWVSLNLVSVAWEVVAEYSGWGRHETEKWRTELAELKVICPDSGDLPEQGS